MLQVGIAQAPFVHASRRKAFYKDVALLSQAAQYGCARLASQVQSDALFPGVVIEERGALLRVGLVVRERPRTSGYVAGTRTFDLYYFGPQSGQKLGAYRACHILCDIEDFYVTEGQVVIGHISPCGIAIQESYEDRAASPNVTLRRSAEH